MIASLHDEFNQITIPGFYDGVLDLSASDRAAMAQTPFDLEAYQKDLGIQSVHGEKGYSTLERASIRPTLDVNGIWGGYRRGCEDCFAIHGLCENFNAFSSQSKFG
jgi:hypothetical protein